VIGVDDEEFGQRLRAFVVRRDGWHVTAEQVRAYVKQNLARYKVPRDVIFLDELPRTPTGKVLKRELAALRADGRDDRRDGEELRRQVASHLRAHPRHPQ
jgi:fatty-acyl-CoA synthase